MEDLLSQIASFVGDRTLTTQQNLFATSDPAKTDDTIVKQSPSVICFSKSRPYQLHQLLLSLRALVSPYPNNVIVLYASSAGFDMEYDSVFAYHSSIIAVKETLFSRDLSNILSSISTERVMFLVDDLIFISPVDLAVHAQTLTGCVFGCQMKLHSAISYSQPSASVCVVPIFSPQLAQEESPCCSFTFNVVDGTCDFRYPFDLCGGIYRKNHVMKLIEACGGPKLIDNPNVFETLINNAYWKSEMSELFPVCSCPSRLSLVVVTVNRVQEKYDVPFFLTSGGDVDSLNAHLLEVNDIQTAPALDLLRYQNSSFSLSVHVADLHFFSKSSLPSLLGSGGIECSVLLPVYNGAKYLPACLRSLLKQRQGCRFELIIMDDGSTDESVAIAERAASELSAEESLSDCVSLRVLRLAHQGLPRTLDAGIAAACCEFVARIDCDDMCEPNRLSRQLSFLRHADNANINVLGSQALLIFEEAIDADVQKKMIVARGTPTHPALVMWTALFRCPVLHPSVMFRRSVVIACGGYAPHGETQEAESFIKYAEDFFLWIRILERYPLSIANLPDVLVKLRRHRESKSQLEGGLSSRQASAGLRQRLLTHIRAAAAATVAVDGLPEEGAESTDLSVALWAGDAAKVADVVHAEGFVRTAKIIYEVLLVMIVESNLYSDNQVVTLRRLLKHLRDEFSRKILGQAMARFGRQECRKNKVLSGEIDFLMSNESSSRTLKELLVASFAVT